MQSHYGIYYRAWNQSLDAVAECITAKRPFSWIGDTYAVLRFIDMLILYKGSVLS